MPQHTLDYAAQIEHATFEERNGTCILVLPPMSRTVHLISIYWLLAVAIFITAGTIWMTWKRIELVRQFGLPITIGMASDVSFVLQGIFVWVAAIYLVVQHRRWGRVPKQFVLGGGQLAYTRKVIFGLATVSWPLEPILDIDVKWHRVVFAFEPVAKLVIRRRGALPRSWPLWCGDVEAARQFVERVRPAIGHSRRCAAGAENADLRLRGITMPGTLEYAPTTAPPYAKWLDVCALAFLCYPVLPIGSLYGEWLLTWGVLGHVPRHVVDEAGSITGSAWMHDITLMSLFFSWPAGLVALVLNVMHLAINRPTLWRSIARIVAMVLLWLAFYALLRFDPGDIYTWWMID